jgi:DNA helicase II / ATP-dependent DNA helicase PcrA
MPSQNEKTALQQNFETLYKNLNKQQKKAVDTIDGPVMVVAGPGTGKTQLLSMRVANILDKTDTPASSILCLTFTEAAAINMRQRLEKIIGIEAYKIRISTFHGFGLDFIAWNPEHFNFTSSFKPADELAKIAILENILKSLEYDNPLNKKHPDKGWVYLNNIISRIKELKEGGLNSEEFLKICLENKAFWEICNPILSGFFEQKINKKAILELPNLVLEIENLEFKPSNLSLELAKKIGFLDIKKIIVKELKEVLKICVQTNKTTELTTWKNKNIQKNDQNKPIAKDFANLQKHLSLAFIYGKYQEEMNRNGLFDFEDMLLETINVLEKNNSLRFSEQEKYLYILVDEFQDTNEAQMRLVSNLINLELTENKPNILVVGDDDQSIYKFQGASIANLIGFKDRFKNVQIISLINNYRSNQQILDFAAKIINQANQRLTQIPEVTKQLISMK